MLVCHAKRMKNFMYSYTLYLAPPAQIELLSTTLLTKITPAATTGFLSKINLIYRTGIINKFDITV